MVQKVIQDLIVDVQRTTVGYQVYANTAQVIQAPTPSFMHPWPNDRDFMDNPVLMVHNRSVLLNRGFYCSR